MSIVQKLFLKKTFYSQVNHRLKYLLFSTARTNRTVNENVCSKHDLLNNKSDLFKYLYSKITMSGPLSVANYMKEVLTHPTKGYYINKDVFGTEGDFTTSPEITQLFGEMIGIWIINECKKIHNKQFQVVELGPGRGTLANDILRVFQQLGMSDKLSLHLVEVSPVLSDIQEKILCSVEMKPNGDNDPVGKYYKKGITANNVEVFWYKSITDVPEGFNVYLAHEFFDALPIHKFQKTNDGWFEVLVDIDPVNTSQEKFRYVLSKTAACDKIVSKNEKRDHVEISLESVFIMNHISSAITQNGGFALIIDYGHNGEKTDTFRAFKKHNQCDPLLDPGTADLTADVDFGLLKKVALESNKLLCYGPVDQRNFLMEIGINVRLLNLYKKASKSERDDLKLGYNKIMDKEEMGTKFKVVSMFPYVLKDFYENVPVDGFEGYVINK